MFHGKKSPKGGEKMIYRIRIKRQKNKESTPYWQEFEYSGEQDASIAAVLNELNSKETLTDCDGKEADETVGMRMYGQKMRGMCHAY